MREKYIESRLVAEVKRKNGMCPKFVSPGLDGMPDRLILLPNGKIAFVEIKAPGKTPRALQLKRHQQLLNLGFKVFVIDNTEKIKKLIEEILQC